MRTVPMCAGLCALFFQPAAAQADAAVDWQPQRAVSTDFAFSVLVQPEPDQRVSVQAIRVLHRKTGKVVQEIGGIGGMAVSHPRDEVLRLGDANGDGRPDLVLAFADGGAGPNFTNHYYLFDPELGIFALHRQLSELPQPSIGPGGTITAQYRGSCCDHRSETYRFVGRQLTLVAESYQSHTADGKWIDKGLRKLVGGRWHDRRWKVRRRD